LLYSIFISKGISGEGSLRVFVKLVIIALIFFNFIIISPAKAVTLDFEGLTTDSAPDFSSLPADKTNYGGFNWSNSWGLISKDYYSGSGYDIGTTSGSYTAYNLYGDTALINMLSGTFNFKSANLTSAFNDNNKLLVEGYNNGVLKYSLSKTLTTTASQNIQFNFNNIDTLVFKPNVAEGADTSDFFFAMDDFTYTTPTPTPEPTSMLIGFLSLGGLLGLRRKRKI